MIPNAKTPAPWNYVGGGVIEDAAGKVVAYLAGRLNDPEITDNVGCQIAAAPELYEALKDLLVVIATDDLIAQSGSCMQQARAALAKARGDDGVRR